jgi:hypothetical protein
MDSQTNQRTNDYMSTLKSQIVMVDKVVQEVAEATAEAQGMNFSAGVERRKAEKSKKTKVFMRITSPIIALIFGFGIASAMSITFDIANFVSSLYFALFDSRLKDFDKIEMIVKIAISLITFIVIWCIRFKPKAHLAKADEYEKQAKEKFAYAKMLEKKYADCLAVVPQKYLYPIATHYLAELFCEGRADTLPDALEKLDEQIHRWNMEEHMRDLIAAQRESNERLARMEALATIDAFLD